MNDKRTKDLARQLHEPSDAVQPKMERRDPVQVRMKHLRGEIAWLSRASPSMKQWLSGVSPDYQDNKVALILKMTVRRVEQIRIGSVAPNMSECKAIGEYFGMPPAKVSDYILARRVRLNARAFEEAGIIGESNRSYCLALVPKQAAERNGWAILQITRPFKAKKDPLSQSIDEMESCGVKPLDDESVASGVGGSTSDVVRGADRVVGDVLDHSVGEVDDAQDRVAGRDS